MLASFILFSALAGLSTAQSAIVNNHCDSTVYVQSFPYDGSAPGPLTTVKKGETFSEKFRPSGSVRDRSFFLHNINFLGSRSIQH